MTTPGICAEGDIPPALGDGRWDCKQNKIKVKCTHRCTRGKLKTGATAMCNLATNKWRMKKAKMATCIPCSSDPFEKYPIGGGGKWKCKIGTTTKCSIKCKNGAKVSGAISCNRTKSMTSPDRWITPAKDASKWTCELCQQSALPAKLAKKFPDYKFDEKDWIFHAPNPPKTLASGNMICPRDRENKKTLQILFTCKASKKGKEIWQFKGDPTQLETEPDNVKCIKK